MEFSIGMKKEEWRYENQKSSGRPPVLEKNTALSCLEDVRLSAEGKKEDRVLTFSR